MKPAKIAVLGIAIAAGGAAAYLATSTKEAPPPAEPVVVQQVNSADVLVTAVDLPMGRTLGASDLKWQPWPLDMVPAGVITRRDAPNGVEQVSGAIARVNLLGGEPVRREKLIRPDGSGFMAAILPAGRRAVAISIEGTGLTSAGGFVLPNDRVDVIRTYRDDEASKAQGIDVYSSETILSAVRVLAIGQNLQEKIGEKAAITNTTTATLELDQRQAELVVLAQKVGQLSLALRSIVDAGQVETIKANNDTGLTIVRYGVAKQSPRR